MQGVASKLGGGARSGGPAGRAAAGLSRRGRPGGRAVRCLRVSQTCPSARRAAGPSLPCAIARTRRPPSAPRPARGPPAGGAGIPPRGPPPAVPPGRSLPPAPRAPPSRPPANCVPPGPARSHMPPQGMPGLSGGGRALGRAGPGQAGPGRERPAGKVGERERASPRPPRPPAPPLSRPLRRPGLITASHTFPA